MKIIRSIKKMQQLAVQLKKQGKAIGFVPTMGCLHEGHLSLAKQARLDADITVMSIFVNPAQFSPNEDFKKYPRNFKRDCYLAKESGVDIIFHPSQNLMYPKGFQTYIEVEILSKYLCGKSRPGHFKGVATIVMKLFNIVNPDIAYFGQKDAQQARIIRQMASDLNMDLKIKTMPIVREHDGFAMSSRNAYLSPTQRKDALVLKNALQKAKDMINSDEIDVGKIKKQICRIINSVPSLKIDYVSVVNADTLEDIDVIRGRVLIALAVKIGNTRLIDNAIIKR